MSETGPSSPSPDRLFYLTAPPTESGYTFFPGPGPRDVRDKSSGEVVDLDATVDLHQLCSLCTKFRDCFLDYLGTREKNLISLSAGFQHHVSRQDLIAAAKCGCHLCSIILPGFNRDFEQLVFRFSDHCIYVKSRDSWERKKYLILECSKEVTDLMTTSLGSQVPIYTASSRMIDWLHSELKNCEQTHERCNSFLKQRNFVPTRLIRIEKNGIDDLYMRLIDTKTESELSTATPPPYIALSYCWGSGPKTYTLIAEREAFLRAGFGLSFLPPVIAQAAEVASHLGVQYLWVDSICIRQDSKEDWKSEGQLMQDVYMNSLLTLAASGASGSSQSLFSCRSPLNYSSCCIATPGDIAKRIANSTSHPNSHLGQLASSGVGIFVSNSDWRHPRHEDCWPCWHAKNVLWKRGWAMQERCLSLRMGSYGAHVVWQCLETTRCEGSDMDLSCDESASKEKEMFFPKDPVPDDDVLFEWGNIAHIYSKAELTYPSDKEVAFAGMANRLKQLTGWTYFHGLWDHRLAMQLLWKRSNFWIEEYNRRIPGLPTWSWLSLNTSVSIPVFEFDDDQIVAQAEHVNLLPNGKMPTTLVIEAPCLFFSLSTQKDSRDTKVRLVGKVHMSAQPSSDVLPSIDSSLTIDSQPCLPGSYKFLVISMVREHRRFEGIVVALSCILSPMSPKNYERLGHYSQRLPDNYEIAGLFNNRERVGLV